jgi:hypothetical protein
MVGFGAGAAAGGGAAVGGAGRGARDGVSVGRGAIVGVGPADGGPGRGALAGARGAPVDRGIGGGGDEVIGAYGRTGAGGRVD